MNITTLRHAHFVEIMKLKNNMSLVYAEFPSDLPPSMSDEELEQLKKQYRENNRSKREHKPEVERIDPGDTTE
jgi:hypothetical protein